MSTCRLLILGLLISVASLANASQKAACLQFPFRDQSLEEVNAGVFESRNGEFSVTLPFKKQRVQFGSFGNKCLYAINIDSLVSEGHRSVEWVYLEEKISDTAFTSYWKDFIQDYLSKNFGNGSYNLIELTEYINPNGQAAVLYSGTGTNNGGHEGSIYGVVTNFGHRMANVYSIANWAVTPETGANSSAEAASVKDMAESLVCAKTTCASN